MTKFNLNDHLPAIDSMRTTVCWRPPLDLEALGLSPVAYKPEGRRPPQLEKFRANSIFRASSSCSKILKHKKYFNTVKNFRANYVFQGKRRLFKILNDKNYIFTTLNSGHTLCFRTSTSCSKILNLKTIFNAVKIFRANSVFRTSASCSKF